MQAATILRRMEHDDTFAMLRDSMRRFVAAEVVPKAAAWETAGEVPREVLRRMGGLGFLGLRYPERFGGGALDARATALLAEELGRSSFGGFAITVLVHTDMASPHLANAGSPAQLERWMPKVVSGECITAVAVTEPDAGSDVKGIRTTARRDGDHYVLNGSKMFITNGVLADLYFVAAKTDPAAGSKGISILAVEKGTPGFTVARRLDKMGWRCSDTAELAFQDCRVPAENLLGEENSGFVYLMQELPWERLQIAVIAMASAEAAIDWTVAYTRERKAFGQEIMKFQNTRFKLAELKTEVQIGRVFVDRCIELLLENKLDPATASMAKYWCTDLQFKVMDECVQLHGGYGYMWEYPITRAWADSRVQRIYGGTNEIMKELISRSL